MRLSQFEIETINILARKHFGQGTIVNLFGSRTDDLKKGGDIDLFIQNSNDWLLLRETRNIVTHEYPFITDEVIQGLNLLNKHYRLIMEIWKQVKSYIKIRFNN